MKVILIFYFICIAHSVFSKPVKNPRAIGKITGESEVHFSAFIDGNTLYATILADSCNKAHGQLIVGDSCKDGSFNQPTACDAELSVSSTRRGCNDPKPVARIIEINLEEVKIAKFVQTINLSYQGKTLSLKVNR